MSDLALQLRDLGYLTRGLRSYARRRTPAVRRWLGTAVRASQPVHLFRRRRLIAALPRVSTAIPESSGILDVTELLHESLRDAVEAANAVFAAIDLDAMRAHEPDRHLFTVSLAGRIGLDNAILQLALSPTLVRLVADYLGTVPVIEDAMLWYSPNAATIEGSSQFHHLDGQDVRTLQLFVHLEDVAAESGPLTAVAAASSEALAKAVHYRKNERTKRIPDELVERYIRDDDLWTLTGPKGRGVIVDTDRCFHFGSREGTKPRRMLVIQYYSPFAFVLPRRFADALPFAGLAATPGIDPVIRAVLGAD